jgi:hypothetical protein
MDAPIHLQLITMINPEFAYKLFTHWLAIEMYTTDYYDFLSQIDGEYE